MDTLFDNNQLPGRSLSVRKVIVLDKTMKTEEAIPAIKYQMAMELATNIIEGDNFFWWNSGHDELLEYRADCIVLTTDEYVAMKRQVFKDGVKHAQKNTGG